MPSKKVLSIIIIVVALVTSIIITFGKEKSSATIDLASDLISGQKVSIPENPNWQDELGQLDGKVQTLQETEKKPIKKEGETVTDTVSRSLMANYLVLKQNDELDTESAQKLIDQTLDFTDQSITNLNLNPKLYIIKDDGIKSITDYGENLGNILKNNKPTYKESEMDIIQNALQTRNPDKLLELSLIISHTEKLSRELKNMAVPLKFVKAHTDMVNSLDVITFGLDETKLVFSDSIRGLAGLQLYGRGVYTFTQALKATLDFINSNKINYKQGTGGYYLFHGI